MRVLNTVKWLFVAIVACALAYVAYTLSQGAGSLKRTAMAPVETSDRWRRSALGWEQKPLEGTELEVAVASIAAGVAIDSEGEPLNTLTAVQEEMIDAHLRYKHNFPQLGYQEIVEKSRLWLPDDWKYPWRWRDRPIKTITSGRETTIARLKPLVESRLKSKRVADGCADRYIRPGSHTGGLLGGETFAPIAGSARSRVALLKPDPLLKDKGFTTQFFCSRP